MNLQQVIYESLQQHCGDSQEVFLEDLMEVSCGYRHFLKLSGTTPDKPEAGPKVLLREVGFEAKNLIARYVKGCFKKKFREGFYRPEGHINVRIDGFIDETLVEVALVSTLFFDEQTPPRKAVLTAVTKAHLVGAEEVLLIVVDRDKQDWSFWRLTGDFAGASEQVLDDVRYINALLGGEGIPVGLASERTCKRCPFKGSCTMSASDEPDPYRLRGVQRRADVDTKISMEGYLWKLNSKPNGRATEVIHPSEISTTNCDRVVAYGLLGEEERESIDPKLRRIFDFGHAFHDIIQAALKWALPQFEAEVPTKHRELRIKGHCDGRVSPKRGIEIKSIGSKGFEKLTSAKSDHKKQATTYGAILDLDYIDYIYANKETGDLAVFATAIDRSVWHKTATRAARIIAQVDAGELPEQIDSDYICGKCKYAWKCKPKLFKSSGFNDPDTRKLRSFSR